MTHIPYHKLSCLVNLDHLKVHRQLLLHNNIFIHTELMQDIMKSVCNYVMPPFK